MHSFLAGTWMSACIVRSILAWGRTEDEQSEAVPPSTKRPKGASRDDILQYAAWLFPGTGCGRHLARTISARSNADWIYTTA